LISSFLSLKGLYNMKLVGSNLSPFSCNIDDKHITISGCNQVAIPYDARVDGFFKASTPSYNTKNTCKSNSDNELIAAINSADKVEKDSKGIYFSKGGKRVLECGVAQSKSCSYC
jgi:hypothetical protein